jgi:hypothetical protein
VSSRFILLWLAILAVFVTAVVIAFALPDDCVVTPAGLFTERTETCDDRVPLRAGIIGGAVVFVLVATAVLTSLGNRKTGS